MVNDVVAININTLWEVLADEIFCIANDSPMSPLKLCSRPGNSKDSATDLVCIVNHGGLEIDVLSVIQVRVFEPGSFLFVKDAVKESQKPYG